MTLQFQFIVVGWVSLSRVVEFKAQPRMRVLIIAFLTLIAVTSCTVYEKSHATLSPDQKWFVQLETKSAAKSFTRIRVYDTDIYPRIKTKRKPAGSPTAVFIVPIEFHARATEFKWNATSTVLQIEQPELNVKAPIRYDLDLRTFSFAKVEK